ncbi:hypothetical protein [Salibacterium halotolerans]|uniref:Uncharacterized protein n=1 Tax=Salibacterium halotolerans TaxID=1884432 RepID=A0A1I5VQK2_9BACI|nr:hypothetical protein [Salibacterium halotolerans]SFQ09276.1 hypothetical protein SAMN05518683_1171 [Salibacterium halotolerans]
MLLKVLNVCVVLFITMIVSAFSIAGFTPEVAETLFTISWLSVSMRILIFIVWIGAVTNFIRMHYKEKQVRFDHFRIGLLITIVGLLFFEWKNGWPVISSFF